MKKLFRTIFVAHRVYRCNYRCTVTKIGVRKVFKSCCNMNIPLKQKFESIKVKLTTFLWKHLIFFKKSVSTYRFQPSHLPVLTASVVVRHLPSRPIPHCIIEQGEAKLRDQNLTQCLFLAQCLSQAVVCVITPRILVTWYFIFSIKFKFKSN